MDVHGRLSLITSSKDITEVGTNRYWPDIGQCKQGQSIVRNINTEIDVKIVNV